MGGGREQSYIVPCKLCREMLQILRVYHTPHSVAHFFQPGRTAISSHSECRSFLHQFGLSLWWTVSYNDTMKLSSKHLKTLHDIFEDPVRSDVEWAGIESLLLALGAELSEGRGSRVRVYLNGVRAVFHRPHPQKETDKGALKSLRRFLTEADIQAEE